MNLDTRIKYRHLLCFLEIARQGSLARAADSLAISQPAISKTLKELEELLEARLFERSRHGVELTPAGTRFMRYAGPSVQALRDGVSSLRGEARAPSQVRIGVLSTVEGLLMPEVLCRLHQRHEALLISVVTGASAQLLGQLRLGELELVVGRMTDSPQIQGLSFEHLYSESMSLVVRAGHPLLSLGTEALARLDEDRMPELVDELLSARTNISAIYIRGAIKTHRDEVIAVFAGAENLIKEMKIVAPKKK